MDGSDRSRPSLPLISTLIDAVTEHSEAEASSRRGSDRRVSSGSQGQVVGLDRHSIAGTPRSHPPPTPELPPTSSFDFPRPHPGNTSPVSTTLRHNQYGSVSLASDPELYAQKNSAYPPLPEPNSTFAHPPLPDHSNWPTSTPIRPVLEPTNKETLIRSLPAIYPEPSADHPGVNGLAAQRPLPINFPPPVTASGAPPVDPQIAPTWQHHHFYPPANPPQYQQTQERYLCPTCNKPFSRPSSLKIHTYSHTGEKPYKCQHEGCGKQFSVRSNMKRHEKGCHGIERASPGPVSPKAT